MILDEVDYIKINEQASGFPSHYHETFCISLIHKGVETIEMQGQHFYGEPGCLTITNPYEVHSNPLLDNDIQIGFGTIYLSNDVLKSVLNGKNVDFLNRSINDAKANQYFLALKDAIISRNVEVIEACLVRFVLSIEKYSQGRRDENMNCGTSIFCDVKDYIENHLTNKLSLDKLAVVANRNKYVFAKKFKSATGMSPINYVLMKKIFAAKGQITRDAELTPIAYDYNFTDMAHFSKTFKRFVGVSPKAYQNNMVNF